MSSARSRTDQLDLLSSPCSVAEVVRWNDIIPNICARPSPLRVNQGALVTPPSRIEV